MTRVLLHTNDPETARAVLARSHPDLRPEICADYESLAARVAETRPEVVYTCRFAPDPFPRVGLMEAPSVCWVSNAGSGVNHLAPWDPARVTVTNSAGVAAEAMAQYALGAMLYFSLDVPGLRADQRARHWRERSVAPLAGKTLLLIGLGKTGQRIAEIGAALGMEVLGIRANPRPTPSVTEVFAPKDRTMVLPRADFMLVCLPLLDSTHRLIGPQEFRVMKRGVVMVDLSRGGIVEQCALLKALEDGTLRGAAPDVFETEPLPPESPLWTRDDVLISPHCSGVHDGWEERSLELFAENLHRWRKGEPLENVVDPARGY